jgi:putative transcriptional regulator
MKIRTGRYVLAVLIPALALMLAASRARGTQKPAETYFLVAQPDLPDPMFHESVILMLPPTGTELVVGLIVNKPTKVKLGELFPDTPAVKKRTDTAFFGGPVDISAPLVMYHAAHPSDDAVALFSNIYLTQEAKVIMPLLKGSGGRQDLRLYLGRAQWTDEQLHAEMLENSWYNVPSDPGFVFSADPTSVWRTLVARAQAIKAAAPRPQALRGQSMLLPIAWPGASDPRGLDQIPQDR